MAKQIGIVTEVTGVVYVKDIDGNLREITLNSPFYEGDRIIGKAKVQLADGNIVEGTKPDTAIFLNESTIAVSSIDTVIQALERGTDLNETLEATAAGIGDGGEGGGNSFVVLARILESVNNNNYGYDFNPLGRVEVPSGTSLKNDEKISETTPDKEGEPVGKEEEPDDDIDPDTEVEPGEVNPKEHQDNGKGNGVDNAPGNSGNTKGDDADGINTPGTIDTGVEDVIPMPVDKPKGNNGWGNGDQDAPGNSLDNNNAENSDAPNPLDSRDLFEATGNSGNHGKSDFAELILGIDVTSLSDLLKSNNHE